MRDGNTPCGNTFTRHADISGDGSTTKPAAPLIEPCCAVMVEVPADCPVACPPLVIVATFVAEELHCTAFVMARVLPSPYVPVAP